MLHHEGILIAGSGTIARRIFEALVAAGRPARRLSDLDHAAARFRSARTLIVADPTVNADMLVQQAAAFSRHRPIRRPPLRLILVRSEKDSPSPHVLREATRLSIENFDPKIRAARSLLARWPPHTGMDPPFLQVPHILFVGFADPAPALLVQTLRLIHYGDGMPVITLADRDTESLRNKVLGAFPQAERFCRLRFTGIEEIDLRGTPPVTGAFVCIAIPEQGLVSAQQVRAQIAEAQQASPLIHLEIGDSEPAGGPGDWDGQLVPFSWLKEAFRPEVLLDGLGDELARVIHEHYCDSIAAQGRDPNEEPAGRPWENLESSYRDASRRQADHLDAKLASIDCRAVREELVETFTFAPLEAERLAIIEHKRWAADRYLDGWAYAPVRDNARKHHPQLIPYEDLSDPMKDLDRFAVRLVPTLLARSERGLVRMLLVAVIDSTADCGADNSLRRLATRTLTRLKQRYPDRSLVLASTLQAAASRLVVRLALDEHETGLFLLCPRPLSETLAAPATDIERHDLLELAARAERRIILAGAGGLEAWLAQRAEIRLGLGTDIEADVPAKQVVLDPGTGRMTWSFEY